MYLRIATARLCADCSMSFEEQSRGTIPLRKLPRNGKAHGASTDHLIYELYSTKERRIEGTYNMCKVGSQHRGARKCPWSARLDQLAS